MFKETSCYSLKHVYHGNIEKVDYVKAYLDFSDDYKSEYCRQLCINISKGYARTEMRYIEGIPNVLLTDYFSPYDPTVGSFFTDTVVTLDLSGTSYLVLELESSGRSNVTLKSSNTNVSASIHYGRFESFLRIIFTLIHLFHHSIVAVVFSVNFTQIILSHQ